MRIAIILPPYTHKIFSENLTVVDEEFCVAPPIILAYVAAILERHGHKVMLLDARLLGLTKEEAVESLKKFNPDILSFRMETYHFHDTLDWIKYLKDSLRMPVIVGGINLSLYPRETMSHKEIDYGVIGEAVDTLPRLLKAIENKEELGGIPGIIYRDKDGQIIMAEPIKKFVHFDSYPFPARHLLDNEKYYSFISQRKNFTIMLTTTGCPYTCKFCAITPVPYRQRSPKNVVDEIEQCYHDFSVREIDFFDAILLINKPRLLAIFDEMHRRKLKVEWSCRSRVDTVDEDMLREAARAGCRQIYYGIESIVPKILDSVDKRISPEKVRSAIKLTKKYGIRSMGFFMVGNPCETKESVEQTIEFAKDLGVDFVQVCRTIAKPGTDLDKSMIEKTQTDYWRNHVAGKPISFRLPTPWTDLTESEIEALTKRFYMKFYFRPSIIAKRILQLKSLSEFKRYCKVGTKMLLHKSEAKKGI